MQKETKQSFEELKEDYFKYSRLSMGSWRLSKDAFEKQLHSEQITILNDFGKLEKKHLIDHLTYDYRGQPNILKEEKEKLEKYSKEELRELKIDFLKGIDQKKIDLRFYKENLIEEIHKEIDKKHKLDHKEKLALFIIRTTAELKNPSDRCSSALKGDSSSGKDNIIKTVLDLFPEEDSFLLTRGTQSALEEEAGRVKCIAFSEINKHRDNGANSELTEIFKQLAEGGSFVIKRDQKTHEVVKIKSEQKTLFYGTTETESDEELETRYVVIPIKGNATKNKIVVDDVLQKLRSKEYYLTKNSENNWIAESVKNLNHETEIIIPFTELFENKIINEEGKEEYLFDYSKERIKRDAKRIFSLTKAITWLFQKQRVQEKEDELTFIYAEPEDFLLALELFSEFMNTTYEGFDHRYKQIVEAVEELSGKCDGEIISKGYPSEYCGWAIHEQVWKKTGLNKETFKKRLKWLRNEGYIENHWDRSIHGQTSLLKVGNEVGKESVIGVTIPTCTHLLTHWNTPSIRESIYKSKEKIGKNLFSLKRDRDLVKKIPTSKVTTYKTKDVSLNLPSNEEVIEEFVSLPSQENSSFDKLESGEKPQLTQRPCHSPKFSNSEILEYIKGFDGRSTEQIISKFGDQIEDVLTKLSSQGDLFEQKPEFWKVLE